MTIAEQFELWWKANWEKVGDRMAFACYEAGYRQGYADAMQDQIEEGKNETSDQA